jgi:hypothetical protein
VHGVLQVDLDQQCESAIDSEFENLRDTVFINLDGLVLEQHPGRFIAAKEVLLVGSRELVGVDIGTVAGVEGLQDFTEPVAVLGEAGRSVVLLQVLQELEKEQRLWGFVGLLLGAGSSEDVWRSVAKLVGNHRDVLAIDSKVDHHVNGRDVGLYWLVR